jgi:hypothetical protein
VRGSAHRKRSCRAVSGSETPWTCSVPSPSITFRNTGIAFGLFADSTLDRDRPHRGRDRHAHRLLRALGTAASAPARRRRPRARRQRLEPRRPAPARLRDGLFLDLDYWPAFNLADTFIVVGVGSCSSRSWRPTARAPPLAPHRSRVPESDAGGGWTRSSPRSPESGHERSPSGS